MGAFAEKCINEHRDFLEYTVKAAQHIYDDKYICLAKDKFYYIGPNNEVLLFAHFAVPKSLQVTILTYREFVEKIFPQFKDSKNFFNKLDSPPAYSLEELAKEEKISVDDIQKLLSEARGYKEKIAEIRL